MFVRLSGRNRAIVWCAPRYGEAGTDPTCGLASAEEFVTLHSMITATTCSNLAEAELLHSLLVENGIEAFVLDDAFGGAIHLQVADEQIEEAKRILREAAQTSSEEDDGDDEAVDSGGAPV